MQAERLSEYAEAHTDGMFQLLLGVGCVNALAYNVVHYLMIQRTSAVTTTVLGEIKIVGLLLLSALLLGESPLSHRRRHHESCLVMHTDWSDCAFLCTVACCSLEG